MNNIFQQTPVHAIVFKLQVIYSSENLKIAIAQLEYAKCSTFEDVIFHYFNSLAKIKEKALTHLYSATELQSK